MEHPMSCQWGIMEHPWNNPTSTCQWDIVAFSLNNSQPAQYIHHISTVLKSRSSPPRAITYQQLYSRGPALPEQSYITDNLNNQQVQHVYPKPKSIQDIQCIYIMTKQIN